MKYISFYIKSMFLLLVIVLLSACTVTLPNDKPSGNGELSIDEQIKAEYDDLISGKTQEKTLWEFSGVVVDLSGITYNEYENNYNVSLILDVKGTLIGVKNGLVDGVNPVDVSSIKRGTSIKVTGYISQDLELVNNSYSTSIVFLNPEISWSGLNDIPDGPKPDDKTEVIPGEKIGEKIQAEYDALKAGTTTTHTTWEFDAVVIDMTATKFNTSYNTYNVVFVAEVDEVLIGVYNGLINGGYPTELHNLNVGTKVHIVGEIKEAYTVTSGSYTANIEFYNPEISWEGMYGDVDDNPTNPETPVVPDDTEIYNGKVNFAMINDTHGAFDDSNDGYSILRVDSLIDSLESTNGDYIKIANGDIFQGSYVSSTLYGLPLLESLNRMDFDCFVIGNHEFDWGLDKISVYKDGDLSNGEAEFPFLGANIYYSGTTTRPEWIDAYTIVEYQQGNQTIKVGIIGVIGGTQESSILTDYVSDYTFVDDPSTLVGNYVKELRTTKDCDVVVVASHDLDDSLNSKLASLSGDKAVDAIFCAHTHQLVSYMLTRGDGYSIPVVQNYHKNNTLQNVIIYVENDKAVSATSSVYYPSNYSKSSDLTDIYEKYLFIYIFHSYFIIQLHYILR